MAKVSLSKPVVVSAVPLEDKALLWGYHQFPDLWQSEDGVLFLRVNLGQDTYGGIGVQETGLFFCSTDQGDTWQQVSRDQVDFTPETITLKDSEMVRFGKQRFVYHQDCHGEIPIRSEVVELAAKAFPTPNEHGYEMVLAIEHVPDACSFPMSRKASDGLQWQELNGKLLFSDLLRTVITKSRMTLTSPWEHVKPSIHRFIPKRVVCLSDGTLVCTQSGQKPGMDRDFRMLYCLASVDGGINWSKHGVIADQTELSTWGFSGGEDCLVQAKNGDLVCVMRTDMCALNDKTIATMLSRSLDQGVTWSKPYPVAPSSVTPMLSVLDNGVMVLAYGRPGVHLQLSEDHGYTWSDPIRVIGRTYHETAKLAETVGRSVLECLYFVDVETCANIDMLKLGSNVLLLAYSDFKHQDDNGTFLKAVKVVRITVE